ncbi:MbtH family protein [Gordonia jinhuaensis]|uniref:Protein mbtH n=1 Tax=Gordonia jinhuaensis TaxID=1517702 RepID=A0A916TEP7_9ACTN|nr:MbtH family protein [Gordonia jinhuaensis]GGB42057.1 protein mbtH [Gordonia jinhuaensis]
MHTNPFDRDDIDFAVLTNAAGQYSLWPHTIDVPAGWTVVFGPAPRTDCVAHVDENWSGPTVAHTDGVGTSR